MCLQIGLPACNSRLSFCAYNAVVWTERENQTWIMNKI